MVRVELVEDFGRFRHLEAEWSELHASGANPSLCTSHLWLCRWWTIFGEGRQLCVVLVRDERGQLIGAAPLGLRTVRHRRLLAFARLELFPSGEDQADEIDSDYLDVLLRVGHEDTALAAILGYLVREAPFPWHEIVLPALAEESRTVWLCQTLAAPLGLLPPTVASRPGVWVPLEPTALGAAGAKKALADARRRLRRLAERAPTRLIWANDEAGFCRYFPALIALHQRRWRRAGQPGVFASERFTSFHREVGPALARDGGLRIAVLEHDGRPVSIEYAFVFRRVLHSYQAAWDVELDQKIGLGKISTGFMIERAAAEGLVAVDFLKGVSEYKRQWSRRTHYQVDVRLERPTVRARVRTVIERGIRAARELRQAARSFGGERAPQRAA
jgi:CelD/BcsL family acetyltransferase involved in cellulose biosynthesis